MDKVLRDYKKTKQMARRLGRSIRKQQKKQQSELDRAREATLRAKADGDVLHLRLTELIALNRQLLDRLDNEGGDASSAGIDEVVSDAVAAEILKPKQRCTASDYCLDGWGGTYHCDIEVGCPSAICDMCWNTGNRHCKLHRQ